MKNIEKISIYVIKYTTLSYHNVDYYLNTDEEVIGKGCNELIDTLDSDLYSVEFLEPINEFEHPWGILRVQFVKVTLKN